MSNFFQRIKHEIIHVIPTILYFWFAFCLIHFTSNLTLTSYDVKYYNYLGLTIGALFVGKVLIIVNSFSFINAFPTKPLIYNIAWKSFIYVGAILIVRVVERGIHLYWQYKDMRTVCQALQEILIEPVFWQTQIWLFLFFLMYVIYSEFVRVLGKNKVKRMLFG